MKPRAIIGIDNGLTGGIVALCPETGILIDKTVMPICGFLGTNEADSAAVVSWVTSFDCVGVGVEEPPKHAPSAAALRSLALSFGLITGALRQAGLHPCRVTVHEWQKLMLGKVPKGQTKAFALTRARELWPYENWLPGPRHKTPHDGLIDAALIARYLAGWLGSK
jgi:hypothetical protein